VLSQQAGSLGPVTLRLGQLLLEGPLAGFHRPQECRPGKLPQNEQQGHEHDHGPNHQTGLDIERTPGGVFLLDESKRQHEKLLSRV
jgi:hypothetical protein